MGLKILTSAGATARYDEQIVGVFDTLAQLKTFPAVDNATWTARSVAILLGATAAFDQAIKIYAWDTTSTTAGNDTTIVQPTAMADTVDGSGNPVLHAGRWRSPT